MKRQQGIVLAATLVLAVLTSPGAAADDDWKEQLEKIQKGIGDAARQTQKSAQVWDRTSGRELQRRLEQGTNEASRSYERLSRQYGSQTARSIQETADRLGPLVGDAVLQVYETRNRRAGDLLADAYREHGSGFGERVAAALDHHGEEVASQLSHVLETHGPAAASAFESACRTMGGSTALAVQRELNNYIPLLEQKLASPRNQEAAFNAALIALSYSEGMSDINRRQKTLVVNGIRYAAANIIVRDHSGRVVSLETYAQEWIGSNAPVLRGTSIERDPVGSIVYLFAYQDVNYMINEMQIVPSAGGRHRSLSQTLYDSSPRDAQSVLRTLATIERSESLVGATTTSAGVDTAAHLLVSRLNEYAY